MARYIDADALYDKAESWYKNSAGNYRLCYRGLVDAIVDAPTVDAVEVVRCKDCKYYEPICAEYGECQGGIEIYNNQGGCGYISPTPDDFCSYGERR